MMSAFKALRDVSNNFEAELHRVNAELFSAKIRVSFEDDIATKMRDLSLYLSKLRLLRAKPISMTQQPTEIYNDDTTLHNYEELAESKVIEQHVVRHLTQSHAVQQLITAPDNSIHPELVERKEKITEALMKFRQCESELRHLDAVLKEKQTELSKAQKEWYEELGELRACRETIGEDEEMDNSGPYDRKLRALVERINIMRWLIAALAVSRTGYDWLSDPHRRLKALLAARATVSVETFTDS